MSISLVPPAVEYADADDFPSRPPLRAAAAPPLLEEVDRRVLPSMDRKSGKAEGHITTCTSFRCLFLLPPLVAEAAFRAAADDDDLAIFLWESLMAIDFCSLLALRDHILGSYDANTRPSSSYGATQMLVPCTASLL